MVGNCMWQNQDTSRNFWVCTSTRLTDSKAEVWTECPKWFPHNKNVQYWSDAHIAGGNSSITAWLRIVLSCNWETITDPKRGEWSFNKLLRSIECWQTEKATILESFVAAWQWVKPFNEGHTMLSFVQILHTHLKQQLIRLPRCLHRINERNGVSAYKRNTDVKKGNSLPLQQT